MPRWKLVAALAAAALIAGAAQLAAVREAIAHARGDSRTLTVTIVGNSKITTGHTCEYTAQISGGSPPYIYNWQGPNLQYGTDETFYVTGGSIGVKSIHLSVVEVNSEAADEDLKGIVVTSGGSGCYD